MLIFDFFGLVELSNPQKTNYIKNRKAIESNTKVVKIKTKDSGYKTDFIISFTLSAIILINTLPFIVYSFLFHLKLSLYYTYKILKQELNFIKNHDLKFCNLDWKVITFTTISKISSKVGFYLLLVFLLDWFIGIDNIHEGFTRKVHLLK